MGNVKRVFYAFVTLLVVFMIYRMSVLLLILGLKEASRQLFFITLSLYLFIPLIKSFKFKGYNVESAEIRRKIKKIYKGIKDDKVTTLQGITLKSDKKSIDIDSLILTPKGVFNIAFCNEKGRILVKEFNSWVKLTRGDKELEITSPINIIRRNREMLSKVFKEEEIIDLIVMVNDRADVEEEEISSVPIIRYDDIADYIENYTSEDEYDSEELYDKLYPLIYKTEDLDKDLKFYEKYLDNKWQYRSRLTIISFGFIFYIMRIMGI